MAEKARRHVQKLMDTSDIYSRKHYGAGQPGCPICGGAGYVYRDVPDTHPDFGRLVTCKCFSVPAAPERPAESRIDRFRSLGHLRHLNLDSFSPRPNLPADKRDTLHKAMAACSSFAAAPKGWMLLTGPHGVGKTHLAVATALEISRQGGDVIYLSLPSFIDFITSGYRDASEAFDTQLHTLMNVGVLVLDDLDTSERDWQQERIHQLLGYRYVARQPTLLAVSHHKFDAISEKDRRMWLWLSDDSLCERYKLDIPAYRPGAA